MCHLIVRLPEAACSVDASCLGNRAQWCPLTQTTLTGWAALLQDVGSPAANIASWLGGDDDVSYAKKDK